MIFNLYFYKDGYLEKIQTKWTKIFIWGSC